MPWSNSCLKKGPRLHQSYFRNLAYLLTMQTGYWMSYVGEGSNATRPRRGSSPASTTLTGQTWRKRNMIQSKSECWDRTRGIYWAPLEDTLEIWRDL